LCFSGGGFAFALFFFLRFSRPTAGRVLFLLQGGGLEEKFEIGIPDITGLQILYTNDLHGQVERMPFVSTLVKEKRWKDGPSLLLDSGDWSRGHSLCERFEGMPMVEIMNAIGYDAVGLGEGEFGWPLPAMTKWAEKAAFPLVCSNVFAGGDTPPPFVQRWVQKKVGPLSVGIFGLSYPVKTAGNLHLEEPAGVVGEVLRHFSDEGVQVVILLSQLGLPEDMALARAFPRISVIVGGRSHHFLPHYLKENETYILQSGSDAQYLGAFTLELGSVISLASFPDLSKKGKKSRT